MRNGDGCDRGFRSDGAPTAATAVLLTPAETASCLEIPQSTLTWWLAEETYVRNCFAERTAETRPGAAVIHATPLSPTRFFPAGCRPAMEIRT